MQRLGIILPSSNTTVEREFSSVLEGADFSVHYTRVHLNDVTIDGLERMEAELEDAARLLKDADVDTVAFACTSAVSSKAWVMMRFLLNVLVKLRAALR
jgi:maleate isomerase